MEDVRPVDVAPLISAGKARPRVESPLELEASLARRRFLATVCGGGRTETPPGA